MQNNNMSVMIYQIKWDIIRGGHKVLRIVFQWKCIHRFANTRDQSKLSFQLQKTNYVLCRALKLFSLLIECFFPYF